MVDLLYTGHPLFSALLIAIIFSSDALRYNMMYRYANANIESLTQEQMQISTWLALSLHPGLDVTRLDSLVTLVSRVLLVSLVLCDLGSELALPINLLC
jgi:hypothetical protein